MIGHSFNAETDINERIVRISSKLASALGRVVDAVPGAPHTPTQLAGALGVNKDLSHRVVVALRNKDPIAIAHLLPGATPLRRFIKAGVSKGVPAVIAEDADRAVEAFDKLIREEAGDRSDFDAIISAWLPEARNRFEMAAKQSLYRGARHLKGIAADVIYYVMFLHPSRQGDRHDMVQIRGYLGLRRVRPGAVFKIGVQSGVSNPEALPQTLDGHPVQDLRGVFLDKFCSGPPVMLDLFDKGDHIVYALKWGDKVGLRSSRDIVLAELRRRAPRAYRLPDDPLPKTGVTYSVNVPSRAFICDLIWHESVYPRWEPRLRVMETGELGTADPNDSSRDLDVLDINERIEPLGSGVNCCRAAEIPNYIELLGHVCDKMNWNPDAFRTYRTRIEYPVFGSQIQYSFDLEEKAE